MNRFFLSEDQFSDVQVVFPPDLAHQILHVLRLQDCDFVQVLDNKGLVYRVALIVDADRKRVTGRIISSTTETSEPITELSLCFGLSSRDKVELILQKGTEIGVSAFFPFISSRTLVQSETISSKKADRWQRIIREAAEQAHRGRLPELNSPMSFTDCLSFVVENHDICLAAWEGADPVRDELGQRMDKHDVSTIALFVGPEGGFSESEIRQAQMSGCQVISIGERILRMETAAIVLPALVLYELGDL